VHSDDLRAEQPGEDGDTQGAAPMDVEPVYPPKTHPDQAVWRYDTYRERGRVRQYSGHVTYLSGAAGERLRGDLTAAIHDLLEWAAAARNAAEDLPEQDKDDAA